MVANLVKWKIVKHLVRPQGGHREEPSIRPHQEEVSSGFALKARAHDAAHIHHRLQRHPKRVLYIGGHRKRSGCPMSFQNLANGNDYRIDRVLLPRKQHGANPEVRVLNNVAHLHLVHMFGAQHAKDVRPPRVIPVLDVAPPSSRRQKFWHGPFGGKPPILSPTNKVGIRPGTEDSRSKMTRCESTGNIQLSRVDRLDSLQDNLPRFVRPQEGRTEVSPPAS